MIGLPLDAIAAVVVNYRTADRVIAALPALLDEFDRFQRNVIVIVDNASPGGDGDKIAAYLATEACGERVRLVRSPVNGGFAAGNNLGFAELQGLDWTPEAVLLINPDSVPRTGSVDELVRVLCERPHAGVVGARLENPDGSSWDPAFNFPTLMNEFAGATGLGFLSRRWPILNPTAGKSAGAPVRADWITGAAMLIRAETLRELGAMDEAYFLYYEEVDFMRRAAERGWEIWYAPAAVVLHESGASTGFAGGELPATGAPDYWFHSWRRYFSKNHGVTYARAAAVLKLAGLAILIVQMRLRGRRPPLPRRFWREFLIKGLFGR